MAPRGSTLLCVAYGLRGCARPSEPPRRIRPPLAFGQPRLSSPWTVLRRAPWHDLLNQRIPSEPLGEPMTLDLAALAKDTRALFTVALKPLQGDRFQPTGFPSLGAATYQTERGPKLLVESAQSMANRLETTCWNVAEDKPIAQLAEISHVTRKRHNKFLTDTMLDAHRLNSPYLLQNKEDKALFDELK